MFSNIRLTQRLWLIVIAYWVALAAVMGVSAWGLNSARDSLNRMHDDRMVTSNQLADMAELLSDNRMQVLLTFQHDPSGLLFCAHDHAVDVHLDAIAKNRDEISRIWALYKAQPKSPEETSLATDAETKRAAWLVKLGQVIQAMKSGNFDPGIMAKYLQASSLEGDQAVKSMATLRIYQEKEADSETKAANSRYQTSLIVFALAILLGAVPATLLTLTLLRRMKTGFELAHTAVAAIAKGDLSQPVPASGGDEIGQMLSQVATMRDNLHRLIGQVRSGAEWRSMAALSWPRWSPPWKPSTTHRARSWTSSA